MSEEAAAASFKGAIREHMKRIYLHQAEVQAIAECLYQNLHPLCIMYRKETDIEQMEWEYEWYPNEFCLLMKDGTDLEFVAKLGESIKYQIKAETDFELEPEFNLVFMTQSDFSSNAEEAETPAYSFKRDGIVLSISDDTKKEYFEDWNTVKDISERITSLEEVIEIDLCKDLKPGIVSCNPSFDLLVSRHPHLLLVQVDAESRSEALKIQREINQLIDAYYDEKGIGYKDRLHAITYASMGEHGVVPSFVSSLKMYSDLGFYYNYDKALRLQEELERKATKDPN